MAIESWLRIAEIALVVLLVPSVRKIAAVLIELQQTTMLLSQSVKDHREAFYNHLDQDERHFYSIDKRLGKADGDLREIIGMIKENRRAFN